MFDSKVLKKKKKMMDYEPDVKLEIEKEDSEHVLNSMAPKKSKGDVAALEIELMLNGAKKKEKVMYDDKKVDKDSEIRRKAHLMTLRDTGIMRPASSFPNRGESTDIGRSLRKVEDSAGLPLRTSRYADELYRRHNYMAKSPIEFQIEDQLMEFSKKNNNPEVQKAAEDVVEGNIINQFMDDKESRDAYLKYLRERMRTS